MTVNQAYRKKLDAEILLSHVLKRGKDWLFANPDYKLSDLQLTTYNLLLARRARGWPVAYLTGHREFYGLDFKINRDVLVPRPETELLVELALSFLLPSPGLGRERGKGRRIKSIIDIGTGSGCIIVSLAVILRRTRRRISRSFRVLQDDIRFFATDNSAAALRIARANALRHGVAEKIKFVRGDLLDPLLHLPLVRGRMSGGYSLIIANLPYLTPKQYNSNPDLSREPRSALIGGRDGLKYHQGLFEQIKAICHSAGIPEESQRSFGGVPPQDDSNFIILLEHDPRQKNKLTALAKKYLPAAKLRFHKDLAGRWRVMELNLPNFQERSTMGHGRKNPRRPHV